AALWLATVTRQQQQRRKQTGLGAAETRRDDVLEGIEMLEELDILEGAPHASAGNAMRRPTRHVHALEHNHASRRQQQARDNIEQGGFAGPIRSNQRGNRPLSDLETRPVQGCQPTKVFVEVLDDQHHHRNSQKQKGTYVGYAFTGSLLYIEHRRRVATHHLLLILPRQAPPE